MPAVKPLTPVVVRQIHQLVLTQIDDTSTGQYRHLPAEDVWISLRAAVERTPYSQEHLNLLARTGRLDAVKRGRNWVTTRRAVEE